MNWTSILSRLTSAYRHAFKSGCRRTIEMVRVAYARYLTLQALAKAAA
jgi:hypothetical protein